MPVFREMMRTKSQLSREECAEVLKSELRGVLSVQGDDGYPYGVPLNHYYEEEDGCLYFHSGPAGHKVDAVRRCGKASFCVYDGGFRREGEWALNIRSVIVFGRIEPVEDRERLYEIARRLSRKFTDDGEFIEKQVTTFGPRTFMFRLVPEHMTGRLVHEE